MTLPLASRAGFHRTPRLVPRAGFRSTPPSARGRTRRFRHVVRALVALAAATIALANAAPLVAQETGRDVNTERRRRAGIFLEPGWHPYLAIGPAIPMGRLGELTGLGLTGSLGAWFIRPESTWPGLGMEASYTTLPRDTDEPLPGRYQLASATLRLTSKGRQRVFFDWLGGYGSAGVGVVRHGAEGASTITSATLTGGVGMLLPVAGREGFIEARVQHVFTGETLGRGRGLTIAPLLVGVRF